MLMNNDIVSNRKITPSEDASLDSLRNFEALQAVIQALQPLEPVARQRIFSSAATFLNIGVAHNAPRPSGVVRNTVGSTTAPTPAFSEDRSMSPKEFLLEKQPKTDVERIACLAFYLTHYRDTPHFKTLDLSKLNTEAAQPKFANAANAANNAVKTHYLVPSTKGNRQLSAMGEQFVRALPDRDSAKAAMSNARPRRRTKRSRINAKTEEG